MNKNKITPPEIRFWRKVSKTEGCWNWTGSKTQGGYGRFWDGSKVINAHWFLLQKTPGFGEMACHTCDNPACVNPDHIFVGTQFDNMRDCVDKKRSANVRRCGESHPLSKLSHDKAFLIKAFPRFHGSISFLSKKTGLCRLTIQQIKDGLSWKHLPAPTPEDSERAKEFFKP